MEVDKNTLSNDEKPLVTIWIAARNEEGNIIECLESIHATNFPKINCKS
jgi:hypothetical protein